MHTLQQVVYTGTATATGGREGTAKSDDGKLELALSTPKELGGAGGEGTNPEQMFAAGYSACFIGALKHVAASQKIKLADDINVTGDVSIGPIEQGFAIAVKLTVDLGELEREKAQALVDAAHQVCPYSNATRGNIAVDIALA
ncbi:MAG: organic hydroperoxide resistance protein [Alteromonas sp.]|uniref:organic hydroperoxide resistance protein n=1 Tax=unclassified Alteromonas TaxID=2614992 RepID=UPI0009032BD2|nr:MULTISPECIES: organic hydroperoxide resistance protein [unclassified Alteromonas]APE05038.1 organic hydroperoxide resistance protein [Alteromonas sp. RW2A1]AUC87473.1 organic hydroperoxide resistance protein [Alteromonas sp. MB-3u-76]MAI65769.1 organic hydroperoxide resistance protein [Alteromonas sp.]